MKIGILVQARMSSQRLPNKVMQLMNGKPLVGYLLDGMKQCTCADFLALITSIEPEDYLIYEYCMKRNVVCYRGSLHDVAGRFLRASQHFGLDAFVRVNGDSPLLDYRLVDSAIATFRENPVDLVTNTFPRSFPKGQSVEVLNCKSFEQMYEKLENQEDFEHVTRYFYQNPEAFSILNISSQFDYGALQLSVDTSEDMARFERIVSKMKIEHWRYTWQDMVALL